MAERHRFGRRGRFVQQRGVGDFQSGQLGHHRLEVKQNLQAALRDFRLVRRVGRVPGGILQHVAPNHTRGMGVVIPGPDQRFEYSILPGQLMQFGECLFFGNTPRQLQWLVVGD